MQHQHRSRRSRTPARSHASTSWSWVMGLMIFALLVIAPSPLARAQSPVRHQDNVAAPAPATFRDDNARFSLRVPEGWMLESQLAQVQNEFVRQNLGDNAGFAFVAAFVPDGSASFTDTTPYVMLQYSPGNYKFVTFEQVEQALQAQSTPLSVSQATASIRDLVQGIEVGKPVVERTTKRFYLRLTSAESADNPFDAMCMGVLTSHGLIQANAYAPVGSNADVIAVAQAFVDSITLDEGTQFVPVSLGKPVPSSDATPSATSQAWSKIGGWLMRGALISLVVVGACVLWAWWSVRPGASR